MNHPVHPYVQMSCKKNFTLTDEAIQMKLYTVEVYDLRMCMKEGKPRSNMFQGG